MSDTLPSDRDRSTGSDSYHVLVIGTGVDALAASLALHDAGHTVDRFASAGTEATATGGTVLTPTLHDFLLSHGVVDPESIAIPTLERRDLTRDGPVASTLEGDLAFTAPDAVRHHLRAALPAELADPAGRVHANARPDTTHDGTTLVLEDGGRVTGDLLVAADGWLSDTRRRILPAVSPEYAGYVAWHGTVPESALPSAFVERFVDALTVSRGPGDLIAAMVLPDETGRTDPGHRRLHWEWYRPLPARDVGAVLTDADGVSHDDAVDPGALQPRFVAALCEHVADHAAALRRLVRETPDPGVQPVVDLAVPRAVVDRTLLLGDAAFATRRHSGAAAAKSLQDATTLVRALERYPALPDALTDWAATQEHSGRQLVEQGRQTDLDHLVGQA